MAAPPRNEPPAVPAGTAASTDERWYHLLGYFTWGGVSSVAFPLALAAIITDVRQAGGVTGEHVFHFVLAVLFLQLGAVSLWLLPFRAAVRRWEHERGCVGAVVRFAGVCCANLVFNLIVVVVILAVRGN